MACLSLFNAKKSILFLKYIFSTLAIAIWPIAKVAKTSAGTHPPSALPGKMHSLGGAGPKKYLRNPDLVMRKEMAVVIIVTTRMVMGKLP